MRVSFASTVRRLASHTLLAAAAVALASVAVVVAGSCQAPLEQKRGYVGDFCNGSDDECRAGLVCEDGVCSSLNNARSVCNTVCSEYGECNLEIRRCESSCQKTLKEWTEQNTARFEECHTSSGCEKFEGRERPWNYCYNQLPPAPDERLEVCDDLESQSETCLNSRNIDPKGRIENMKSACKTEARTVSDERWENNELCAEQTDEDGNLLCGKLFQCVNKQFELRDEDRLPTSPPEE